MVRRLMLHLPSPAMIVALIALFVALGGVSAYAVNEWNGSNIVNESLTGADIAGKPNTSSVAAVNGSVTGYELYGQGAIASLNQPFIDGTVTTWDIKDNTILGRDVQDNSLTGSDVVESTLTKVADADQLDGMDSQAFARLGGLIAGDGTASQGTGFTPSRLDVGEYQISFPAGTLSSSACPPIAVVTPFSGSSYSAEITGRGCSGLGAGSFTTKILDSAGTPHDSAFLFIAM